MKYEVYTLDVWGNAQDGYEVNDSYKQGVIDIDYIATDNDILDAIDNLVGISNRALAQVNDDGEFIEITDKTDGMPVFHLYLIENE